MIAIVIDESLIEVNEVQKTLYVLNVHEGELLNNDVDFNRIHLDPFSDDD